MQHANYAELRHGPEFVDNLRRNHPANRQSAAGEPRTAKADITRTRSLQQPASDARRWNVNERAAYQPSANQSLVYTPDSLTAKQGTTDLNQSLPVTQSMRQTDLRYQAAAADGGDMMPNISIRPTGPPPSVFSTSYVSNNVPLTSSVDVVRPTVPPVSSAAQQVVAADQYKSLRDSFDLPAPPTPPSTKTTLSGNDQLPSPPLMITPPPDADGHFSALPLPQYVPSPELVAAALTDDQAGVWHGAADAANVASAIADTNSDSSSLIAAQQTEADQPLVRDTRSDLLAAIREGIISHSLP